MNIKIIRMILFQEINTYFDYLYLRKYTILKIANIFKNILENITIINIFYSSSIIYFFINK